MKKAYRITTYIPPKDVEKVIAGVCSVWPVQFGKYQSVFWQSEVGTESYEPLQGSNPTAGEIGKLSKEDSVALYFVIPRDNDLVERIVAEGIRPIHPWEEPVVIIDEILVTNNNLGA